MSQPSNNPNKGVANFGGLLLVITFIVVFGIISAFSPGFPFDYDSQPQPPTRVAVQAPPTVTIIPTEVILLTVTPLPPTATTMPTPTMSQSVAVASTHDPQQVALGQELFTTCASCHAADARGVPNLGKNLVGSDYMRSHSDAEIVQLIAMGRPIWDPDNTTGIDMPSRGGNPRLTNDDILAIVIYLRSLDIGD